MATPIKRPSSQPSLMMSDSPTWSPPDSPDSPSRSPGKSAKQVLKLDPSLGGSISPRAIAFRPALRSQRGGPLAVASQCKAYGPGLEAIAIARQGANFTIESFDAMGTRLQSGGEPFRVDCRGASTVRARVTDNEDGTYSVSWTPSVSGKYYLAISLHGSSLPQSPWCVSCLMPRPDPTKCVLRGEALARAVAREPAAFEVTFNDSLNQVTHAEELDVSVELLDEADDGVDPIDAMMAALDSVEEREKDDWKRAKGFYDQPDEPDPEPEALPPTPAPESAHKKKKGAKGEEAPPVEVVRQPTHEEIEERKWPWERTEVRAGCLLAPRVKP